MISFAAGRAGIVFFGGANLLLFGKKLYIRLLGVVSVLCRCCVNEVSYPCRAMYGCRVNEVSYPCRAMYGCRIGALWSLEGCKGYGVSQSKNNWIILVYAKK